MNQKKFGSRLAELRYQKNISQKEAAARSQISSGRLSRLEHGRASITEEELTNLASVYEVSPDQLRQLEKESDEPRITKIVLTGGPCAGKTTAMSWIQNAFLKRGYRVLFVPETATELMTGGVAPWTCGSNLAYQCCHIGLQIAKEQIFEEAAKTMPDDKILIVCDRGLMDNKAYMSDEDFNSALNMMNLDLVSIRDQYDAVFHLMSTARDAPDIYNLNKENNPTRKESIEDAAALDGRLVNAWTGHPHLRIIDNSTGFEDKMKRLISEISSFLGEPFPYEIERKFLISYPDIQALENRPDCQKVEIIQTYLHAGKDEETRIRQRGAGGSYIYFKTTKKKISPATKIETERRLSQSEYLKLLMEADTSCRQIRKTRYCLTYKGQYFEIDIFPFWKDKAILEIELLQKDQSIQIPEFLHVLEEVTDNEKYQNSYLARADILNP